MEERRTEGEKWTRMRKRGMKDVLRLGGIPVPIFIQIMFREI
jgi:hypothetical protein